MENLTNFLYNRFQFSQQQQQNILLTEQSISETDLLAGHRATNYLLTPAAHLNLTHHYHFWVAHYVNNNVVGRVTRSFFRNLYLAYYIILSPFNSIMQDRKITQANFKQFTSFKKKKGQKIEQITEIDAIAKEKHFQDIESIPQNWQQFRFIVSYSDVFFPFVCLQCYQQSLESDAKKWASCIF